MRSNRRVETTTPLRSPNLPPPPPSPDRRFLPVAAALIALAGMWVALAPYIGPTLAVGRHRAATRTAQHVVLNLIPGLVALIAGLVLLFAARGLKARARWMAMTI